MLMYFLCFLLDQAIGRVKQACDEHGYVMMVTSDHGNAEQMLSEFGGPHTAHTTKRGSYLHHNNNDDFLSFVLFSLYSLQYTNTHLTTVRQYLFG